MPRITFQKETVKELQRQLHEAYALGDVRLVRRIAVMGVYTKLLVDPAAADPLSNSFS